MTFSNVQFFSAHPVQQRNLSEHKIISQLLKLHNFILFFGLTLPLARIQESVLGDWNGC